MCLPNYGGPTVFGALLDTTRGAGWKFGPKARHFGLQRYASSGPILQTTWHDSLGSLELLDFMPLPQDNRKSADDGRRVLVRRLRCTRGLAHCRTVLQPRSNFERPLKAARYTKHSAVFDGPTALGFWSSKTVEPAADRIEGEFTLAAGEELWCAFGPDEHKVEWTSRAAAGLLHATNEYWNDWTAAIDFRGPRRAQVLRSAMLVHLLLRPDRSAPRLADNFTAGTHRRRAKLRSPLHLDTGRLPRLWPSRQAWADQRRKAIHGLACRSRRTEWAPITGSVCDRWRTRGSGH